MTKAEIKTAIKEILALQVSSSIQEDIAEQMSTIIDTAIQDEHDAMKQYVDSKIAALA